MSYVRRPDRTQTELLPASIEEYVAEHSAVRFIDAFVDGLDLAALGFAGDSHMGRPKYHPEDLLKLYLYGYLNRIRSSRRLEAEANRNLEVMWLLRRLAPDFKTIADFRKDYRKEFKGVFKQFNLLCRELGLFGAELVAIDGSKFKAANNPRKYVTEEGLKALTAKIESRIEGYLNELDRQDLETQGVAPTPNREELQAKIAWWRKRQGLCKEQQAELTRLGQTEMGLTDSDARTLVKPSGGYVVGYNVQIAVDAKHHLIVAEDVVQDANDRGQLSPMAQVAHVELEEVLQSKALDQEQAPGAEQTSGQEQSVVPNALVVVADSGYHEAMQLEACESAGIVTYVLNRGTSSGQSRNGQQVFPKEAFIYQVESDSYLCPEGHQLGRSYQSEHRGKVSVHYCNIRACNGCELKAHCTTAKYRKISRLINEAVVERAAARMLKHPDMMQQRKEVVEHVFGTMRSLGHDEFLMTGQENVRGEFTLTSLAYNLRRVLNLIPVAELIRSVKEFSLKRQVCPA